MQCHIKPPDQAKLSVYLGSKASLGAAQTTWPSNLIIKQLVCVCGSLQWIIDKCDQLNIHLGIQGVKTLNSVGIDFLFQFKQFGQTDQIKEQLVSVRANTSN